MAITVEALLAPVTEDAPSGPDLAYDPVRVEIEQAFERPVSIDVTGTEAAASTTDWRRIVGLIETQSAETKDVWLGAYLCRAGAAMGDLQLVLTGAEYLAGLCEQYWETVHPQLEEYGFQGRKGPCESLASVGDFLRPLRRMRLLEHPRLGSFSAEDFKRFQTSGDAEDGYGQFKAALAATPEENLLAIAQTLEAVGDAIRRVDRVLVAQAGDETGANFQTTYETLSDIKRSVLSFSASPPAAEETDTPSGEDAQASPSRSGGAGGKVESRQDVIKALDAIGDYYRLREPGSPIPVLLQRAREWVNLDFLSIIGDIAPGSVDEAKRVLTFNKPEAEY